MPPQTTPAASAPQQLATPVIPVDIKATKALTIEIAKVPNGKTLDPHWTAYVQAIGTPIVAVIAAIIAATIPVRVKLLVASFMQPMADDPSLAKPL